jgi:hypothetical protein
MLFAVFLDDGGINICDMTGFIAGDRVAGPVVPEGTRGSLLRLPSVETLG